MARFSNLVLLMSCTQDGVVEYTRANNVNTLLGKDMLGVMPRMRRLVPFQTVIESVDINTESYYGNCMRSAEQCIRLVADDVEDINRPPSHRTLDQCLHIIKANPKDMFYVMGGKAAFDAFLPYVNQCIIAIEKYEFFKKHDINTPTQQIALESFMEKIDLIRSYRDNSTYVTSFKDSIISLQQVGEDHI